MLSLKETISQLYELKADAESKIAPDDTNNEIWERDKEALQVAIAYLEKLNAKWRDGYVDGNALLQKLTCAAQGSMNAHGENLFADGLEYAIGILKYFQKKER